MRLDWIGAGRTWPRARSKFQAPLFQVRATSTATPPRLDIRTIERKRHAQWAINEAKQAPQRGKKGKAYVLPMFPYPSGTLHMGHLRVYTISDVIARFKHMQGYNVIHPMGWDGFGLPAENAAIERGVDPEKWTIENIAKMKEQLVAMGGRWNWDRELMTCDPKFYKHTQRIFLDLYERGLAYQAESMVNYDPIDQTVLANEQVDGKGYSWRSGAKVEQRKLKQWFLRITHYKEELLKDLDILETDQSWPERVISQQKNWLGKSTGAKIGFDISSPRMKSYPVDVFTTRPDTLYGVQFLALSSSHPLVLEAAKTDSALRTFLDSIPALPPDSKAGYRLPDLHGDNPIYSLDGAPKGNNGKLPVFVAPYVLSEYGGAAVMGVPGHDSRDSTFFKENCSGEEARTVILPTREAAEAGAVQDPYTSPGILNTDCGPFAGLPSSEATPLILTALQAAGFYAEATSTWRLRDWLISRQRYWGTPIPIIHCPKCGPVPVPRASLPVTLPPLPANPTKGNPLASASSWLHVPCPRCSTPAKRETDTMDTFVDSSWYHLRFSDPHNDHEPFSAHAASSTLPVDLYVGGVEHAILHLLYARFMTKFLSSLLPPTSPPTPLPQQKGEPFTRLLAQGMVHGPTYRCGRTGRYLRPSELSWSSQGDRLPTVVATGEAAILSWEKMSKSKHNGVDPSSVIAAHGASATRAHMLFAAPVGEVLDWDAGKIVGVQRWLAKVWRLTHISAAPSNAPRTNPALPPLETFSDADARVWLAVQQALGSVTHAFDRSYALNTVVSTLMELTNTILEAEKGVNDGVRVQATRCLVQMMAPVTPALSEECWAVLHGGDEDESVFDAGWPELDGSVRVLGSRGGKCAVQVDGAVKFVVELPRVPDGMGEEALREWLVGRIGETEGGRKWLRERREWGRWKRVVVVKKGKVVNFVY